MKKAILLIFILIHSLLFSQSKIEIDTTCFVNKTISKVEWVDIDAPRNFCVTRAYISKSEFFEYGLFGDNQYKIKGKKWYIKEDNKWRLFFSKHLFKKSPVIVLNENFCLIPFEKIDVASYGTLYKFKLCIRSPRDETNMIVVFSEEAGIVEINYGKEYTLIRKKK